MPTPKLIQKDPKIMQEIHDMLMRKEDVVLPGIGKLKVVRKPPTIARNPRTGEKIDVPARDTCVFSLSKTLKEELRPAV